MNAQLPIKIKLDEIQVLWADDDSSAILAEQMLGRYANEVASEGPDHVKVFIDRSVMPGFSPHEFRYWIPSQAVTADDMLQDYHRHEALCRGEWSYQCCMARAVVSYPQAEGHLRLEILSSGGISGIPSDSALMHMRMVELDQLNDLKEHLSVFRVDWSEIGEAEVAKRQADVEAMKEELRKAQV